MTDYLERFSLRGKTAAVLGGAGLIGREAASALGPAGARVLLMDVRGSQGGRVSRELRKQGVSVRFIPFDVTRLNGMNGRIERLWKAHGPIHVLVNSSYPRTRDWGHDNTSVASWRKNVDMQMNSVYFSSLHVAELMRDAGIEGSIIHMGSIYGVVGNDLTVYEGTPMTPPVAYTAIKGGVTNLTRYMASRYGQYGIRFNTVCPGGIFDGQNPRFVRQYSKKTPLRRMGRADEVASATLFLASDASSYVTGTAFMVDGGWTAV